MGRYGPMVQIGDVNDEEKPRFAKLKNTQSIETISFDEAMELFRLPRNLGSFEGSDVTVNIGRFGPYIAHDRNSIPSAKNSILIPSALNRPHRWSSRKERPKSSARSRSSKKKRSNC
jgi:topoisomerase IA-like protein